MFRSLFTYTLLIGLLFYSFYTLFSATNNEIPLVQSLTQPPLAHESPWSIRSIDTQVVSKHWKNVSAESIHDQISMVKELNINYVAIGTSYDDLDQMRLWVNEIHGQNLHVWFRSHWNKWEGDASQSATMTPNEYLSSTKNFILNNADLFYEGDSFTAAVEPEQAGVGLGKKFVDWDEYRKFLVDQVAVSNEGFAQIGLKEKVYTNWISVNGWIVENVFTQQLADTLGFITIDHYPYQTETIGQSDNLENLTDTYSKDLDRIYSLWHKPILIGEWGYQIHQNVDDLIQAKMIQMTLQMLKTKPYIVGVNYWVHMGNTSRIISDTNGSQLKYRPSALVIKNELDASRSAETIVY